MDSSGPQSEIVTLVEEPAEGGFTARALGVSVFTEADTMEELRVAVRDAVSTRYEDDMRPTVIRLHVVRDEIMNA